jgi:oligoendopeptidase F
MNKLTNKEIKDKVVLDMKNDEDLKQYAKDIEELPQSSFNNLIKAIDKAFNKVKKEKV